MRGIDAFGGINEPTSEGVAALLGGVRLAIVAAGVSGAQRPDFLPLMLGCCSAPAPLNPHRGKQQAVVSKGRKSGR